MLTQAAAVVERQPDSALLLLETITNPRRLPKPLRTDYALRLVQAKDKAYRDIANDTAILAAADFYLRQKSSEKAALALFYAGRVRQEQGSVEEAAHRYLCAADHAQRAGNNTLQGMAYYNLGGLHYDQLLTDKAIAHYRQACLCFSQKPDDYRRQAMALAAVGDSYSVNEQQDSALRYLERALALAVQHADSALQSSIYHSMGATLQVQGKVEQAHGYFLQAAHLGAAAADEATLYRNLAESYLKLGQRDSAQRYMQLLLQPHVQDSTAIGLANAYELLADMEKQQGSYQKALEYYEQHLSYLNEDFEAILSSSMREVEEKYRLEQVENRHSQWVIRFQRTLVYLLCLLLAAAVVSLRLYRRNLRLSERMRQMAELTEQARAEVEEKERISKEQTLTLEAKEKMLDNLRGQRLDRLKRASLLKSRLTPHDRDRFEKDMHQFDRLVYGSHGGDDWQLLYGSLNELYGGGLDRLRERLPKLWDMEVRVCCLSYAQFDNAEASAVLGITGRTLLNYRTAIRKKLAIPNGADIYEFLKRLSHSEIASS
jgi:tetratricopeptide (TPR) repeat protein